MSKLRDRKNSSIERFERDEDRNYEDRRSNSDFRRRVKGQQRENRRELYRELAYN